MSLMYSNRFQYFTLNSCALMHGLKHNIILICLLQTAYVREQARIRTEERLVEKEMELFTVRQKLQEVRGSIKVHVVLGL